MTACKKQVHWKISLTLSERESQENIWIGILPGTTLREKWTVIERMEDQQPYGHTRLCVEDDNDDEGYDEK